MPGLNREILFTAFTVFSHTVKKICFRSERKKFEKFLSTLMFNILDNMEKNNAKFVMTEAVTDYLG
jgi:hypothetical protein